ncbi:tpt-domain-containing protein [Plasmopara halstedii]|uniref:Tpt-domain-containing protein n=1 Tax=Plasmopara halstedii TaxID=4781 RepID=A0A0P1AN57_PLAHL|nr:tpt-domain-containing protein [Plasmopara halstedii]CEG42426.1 tpt-domain-containing protein [Plasmopara halstedii]|eukprot:XP_024578795.1 tpt-domain-containing protein [Plasmopara halstedii]
MAQAGDNDTRPLPPLTLASQDGSNEDKTVALVATCSFMISLALGFRLLGMYLAKTRQRRKRLRLVPGFGIYVPFPVALHALDVSVFVVLWYAVSIGMTLFNKWFLRVWAGSGYPFATTMTCINMFVKCLLSRVIDRCLSNENGSIMALPSNIYWKLAVPIGLCTALDIMLSNLSLFYITVTFYTIVKSGGNVWNLLFSILLGHQRPSWHLFGVILLISSGIGLASYGSAHFVLNGFLLVLAASVIGTLRWVLTQSMLQAMETTHGASSNKVLAVVYYVSPASAIGLLPIALVSEGSDYATSRFMLDSQLLFMSLFFIFISGCLAFVLIFIEILLVKKTSALSLGIVGSFKDVTQVLLAVFIFGDQLIAINVCGLVVATCGMLLYTYIKHIMADAAEDARSAKLKGYERLSTSQSDVEGGSQIQLKGSNILSNNDDIPEFHMKNERKDLTLGTKSHSSLLGNDLVRRESKDFDTSHV